MRIVCNGFNLYKQLDKPHIIIKNFTPVFEGEVIKCCCINQTFSVFQTDHDCFIFPKRDQKLKIDNKNILKISASDDKIVVLDNCGKLLKIDWNNHNVAEITNVLGLGLSFPDEKIINVCCGAKMTIAYSSRGHLFNLPNKFSFKNTDITDIKCGTEHCLLLDKSGNIYSFGRGSRGQLGHGQLGDEAEPRLVDGLAGIKILKIAAGGWHSCAVSKDGDLYVWGWNQSGQLGIGTDSFYVIASPRVVDVCKPEANVLKIACGRRHTIVLLDNKHLYGCGYNKYKQLKNDKNNIFHTFTDLHDFTNEEVLDIHCGPWNSAVLYK